MAAAGSQRPVTWGPLSEAVCGNVLARRMPRLNYMELILTSNCNLHCSYCFEKDKQPIDMAEETAFEAVDFFLAASRATKKLTSLLFGGEPMLRFDLIQKVHAYARRRAKAAGKKISFNMTTNGTLIDEDRAAWLGRHGVKYLLSMDGAHEDHDRYRRFPDGRGTYDLLASRLPMLKRYQAWMGVKMSITPESVRNLRRNVEELHRIGVNQFIVGYAHGMPWTDEDVGAYEASMLDLVECYLEMVYKKRHFRITSFEEESLRKESGPTPFGCGAGRARFAVDPSGGLYGCSKMATIMGPGRGVLPFGNVFQGYTLIGNRMACVNESIKPRVRCAKCEFREVCGGGCPATNFADTGSVYLPGDLACKMAFVWKRINRYARRRRDEVFGVRGHQEVHGAQC